MTTMQKIMIAIALLGSFALATPAQAGEYWGCHRYHHWHSWHGYGCRPHYYYHYYHCGYHHHYHCW